LKSINNCIKGDVRPDLTGVMPFVRISKHHFRIMIFWSFEGYTLFNALLKTNFIFSQPIFTINVGPVLKVSIANV